MFILFLISLLICIIFHELGHLIVAKLCGCGVEEFAVGFGKKILGFKYKDTLYRFNWFLLGGYCKLKDETIASKDKDSFTNLPYLKKFYISVAGCTVNMLMGLFMLSPNANISYFGYLSLVLGITNLIPLAPCLDGGYVVYLPLFLKIWGKIKGMEIFDKSVQISFNILMALNIICVPFLIYYFRFEILRNIVLCLFTCGDFLIRVFPGILL